MSLNNDFETLLRVSQASSSDSLSHKDESRAPEPTAAELIAKVISNLRQTGFSSNTEIATQAIQRLNPAQKSLLLVNFGSSLRKMEHVAGAVSILNALTAETEVE